VPVITLSRQIGSGGDDIAVAVAQRLGLRLVGKEIISQAARQAGVPEVALAELDEFGLLGLKPRKADLLTYRETVTRLVRSWADAGDVLFVGRGTQFILADRPGVLRIRVVAPLEQRSERVQVSCHVPEDIAAALVNARDQARANYVRRHYGAHIDSLDLYDLILNLAQLSVLAAVDLICAAAQSSQARGVEVSQ
jgi:cytidylate kinase